MQAAILLLLILVPAPKMAAPEEATFPIGAQAIDWGACLQTTFFHADGTCCSPEFGAGTWVRLEDGKIWFSERDGAAHYVMEPYESGAWASWCVTDGQTGIAVEVKIRRGERLKVLPREIE